MQILIQYLKNTNVPLVQKIRFYESLKEAGIAVPKHHLNEMCQLGKNFLSNKTRRDEGLLFLDLILDKIPDQVFSEHLVFFMKQLIGLSANENHAETCFGLLQRLILRSKSMLYMLRDIRHEVFPQLIQLITREVAKVPASCALLSLTQAVVSLFAKSCGPNREPMERFLFKQVAQAELLNKASCDALALTVATLAKCVADPETRHDVQTSYLETMIRTCQLTEKLHSHDQERISEEALGGTIYAATGEHALPQGVDHLQAKLIVWRRLLFQLDVIGALLGSSLSKSFSSDSLFKLLNAVVVSGGRDEHLSFFHPSLILKTVSVMRRLIRRFGDQLVLKNHLLLPFFMNSLDLTLQSGVSDLSFMRTTIYEAMAEWLSSAPPSAFYRDRPESLLKVVKLSCDDVTSFTGANQVALVTSALGLQRAIVLAYGHRDKEHIRDLLLQLIPYAVDLTSPFKGVFRTNSVCRLRLYELLVAFCTNSNTTLMPPTAEIGKLIAEGMNDEGYQVREACKAFLKITDGIINPLECGFSKSYSHALHEHHREVKRLKLTRAERTRAAETQTTEGSLQAPRTFDKATNTETSSSRQAQVDAAIRAMSRPGPKSLKSQLQRKLQEALPTRIVTPSDEEDEEEIVDEEPEDIDDEDDIEAEDEDEEFEEMEFDEDLADEHDFRPVVNRRRKFSLRKSQLEDEAPVIIADDDDDDDVVITNQGPSSSRDPAVDVAVVEENECGEDEEDEELEREPHVIKTSEVHPIHAEADDEGEILEDDEEDDDDMCVFTDGPAPARAQPKNIVSEPNGIDSPSEAQGSSKVLAVLTPVEDLRENGEDLTKEVPSGTNNESNGTDDVKSCPDEVMLEAVIVRIGGAEDEISEEFRKTEDLEVLKSETVNVDSKKDTV